MHVGICGAGIGGVMTGICLANAGAQVTILEAAEHLGEVSTSTRARASVHPDIDQSDKRRV